MTLAELQYLVALSIEKHFGRAAERCHITQPALSSAIKKLEDELGAPLFERSKSGLSLTAVGERVVTQARRVLEEAKRVGDVARDPSPPLSGSLRLGVIATLAPYVILPIVNPLTRAHPALDLTLREGQTYELIARMRLHELDAILMALPITETELETKPLFDEPFFAALPPLSPLRKKKSLKIEDLAAHRLLLLTEGHCLRDQALSVCKGHLALDEPSREQFAAMSLHTLFRMVAADMGCSLVPALSLEERGSAGGLIEVRPFASPCPSRRIGLVWRKGAAASRDVTALAAFILDNLPSAVCPVEA